MANVKNFHATTVLASPKHEESFFSPSTVVGLLDSRAEIFGQKPLYIFLAKPPSLEAQTLSFLDLQARARALAILIMEKSKPGDRVLLVYECNLEYIIGLFACMYAGVIAVPVYPPTAPQHVSRLMAIIQDSAPTLTLTTRELRGLCPTTVDCIVNQDSLAYLDIPFSGPKIKGSDIAFLQYTSGSTGNPKGVVLTHKNLIANLKMILDGFQIIPDELMLSWLPFYHDMGLIGGLLSPLMNGSTTYLVSPMTIVRPYKWLKLISDLKITGTGAPNFAYDLSCERVTDEELKTLDLSSLRFLFSGAEPIRPATMERFAKKFKVCNLNPKVFVPCYGMAEATLMVTSVHPGLGISVTRFQTGKDESKDIVSCGKVVEGINLIIINENDKLQKNYTIGEILIAGDNVTSGYWNNVKEKSEIFLKKGEFEYFRTGDLGYLDDNGNLFVTGRKKELIIIRGKNYYPHDIEDAAKRSHPQIEFAVSAAFAVDVDNDEKVVLALELPTGVTQDVADQIKAKVINRVQDELSLNLHEIILLRQGQIPRTSSGKIRRVLCKDIMLQKKWKVYEDNWKNNKTYTDKRKKVKQKLLIVGFALNNLKWKAKEHISRFSSWT